MPYSGVTVDNAGNLYGTTGFSYAGWGGVYKLSNKNGVWVFSLLFSFNGGNGNTPLAPPVSGRMAASTEPRLSEASDATWGAATSTTSAPQSPFVKPPVATGRSRPPMTLAQQQATVLTLCSATSSSTTKETSSVRPAATTSAPTGWAVYIKEKISRSGGTWTETILHQFGYGNDGSYPASGLIRDGEGNLYGTTVNGGSSSGCDGDCGFGTVYELSPTGSGWVERVLYSFQGQSDGGDPVGGLVMDASGNLYGTTSLNGVNSAGTVFELTHSNGAWTLNTLYSFTQSGQSQAYCYGQVGSLLLDSAGNLYGTTCTGGALGYGAVFKLTHSNGAWTYSSLHDFTNGSDGANPVGNQPSIVTEISSAPPREEEVNSWVRCGK